MNRKHSAQQPDQPVPVEPPQTYGDPAYDPAYEAPAYGDPAYAGYDTADGFEGGAEPLPGDVSGDVTGPSAEVTDQSGVRALSVRAKVIIGAVAAAVLIVAFLVARQAVPRWWGDQVASWVGGNIAVGIALGLLFGIVGTAGLLIFGIQAINSWMHRKKAQVWTYAVLALVVMIPNLLTLAVSHSGAAGAIAAQIALDGQGDGFRGAAAFGAVIGVVAGIVADYFILRRERDRHLPPDPE